MYVDKYYVVEYLVFDPGKLLHTSGRPVFKCSVDVVSPNSDNTAVLIKSTDPTVLIEKLN